MAAIIRPLELAPLFDKPALYTKTEVPFWDDDYISMQMLDAHLNPTFDGASRNLEFIEKSVSWIGKVMPPERYSAILDIGCGPGLYTERYAKMGYAVTGVDISPRSIAYAQESSKKKNLPIHYICQDYLRLSLGEKYDLATMIYCDYGALSTSDRIALLRLIHQHLKPGGKLLLDVFSLSQFYTFRESQTWNAFSGGGFWSPEKHITLDRTCKYPNNVTLKQTSVITNENVRTYYIWDTYFSKSTLGEEMVNTGFKICEYYSDVAGNAYSEQSPTLAILVEK